MKVLIHQSKEGMAGLEIREIEPEELKDNEVKIAVKYVGLNHRDLFNIEKHEDLNQMLYMGEDAAGVIKELGKNVENFNIGDKVMINPGLGWSEKSPSAPESFEVIGNTRIGSFAEEINYPAKNVVKVPSHLTMEEAGCFSLAALTAYRALISKGEVKEGMKVLIPGIGGGVANFVLRFAKATGAWVYVTSRSKSKLEEAQSSGADRVLLNDENWDEILDHKVDLVIESVGAATFNRSLDVLKPGGTMVMFGSSTGNQIDFDLRNFFVNQYTLRGSTMGSQEEFEEMIKFSEKHAIKPLIDKVFDFEDFAEAIDRLKESKQTGKIIMKVSD